MPKVINVLTDLFKRAGIDQNSDDVKMLLSASALNDVEIPDSIVSDLNKGLMNITDAQANPKVKNHIIGQFAPGIESTYFTMLKDLGLTDDEIKEIQDSDQSTGKRIAASKAKIESLLEKVKKGSGKDNNEEMKRILADLESKHKGLLQEKEQALKDLQSKVRNKAMDSVFLKKFGNLKLKGIPDEDKVDYLKLKFNKWAAEKNAALEFDEEKEEFSLKNATDKTLDFTIDGKVHSFDEFLSLNLQNNNLLDSGSGGSGDGQGSTDFPKPKGTEAPKIPVHQVNNFNTIAGGIAASLGG